MIIKDQKRNRGEAQKKKIPCQVRPWDGGCVMKRESEDYGKKKKTESGK